MSVKDILRRNKTDIVTSLCGDHRLILNKAQEKNLISSREYTNLKSINKEDVEGHVVELVDKIMNKGEECCCNFVTLLETDEEIKTTFPELTRLQLRGPGLPSQPVQESEEDVSAPPSKRLKGEEQYQLNSRPIGLCVIFNNENFVTGKPRRGTNKDAQCLAEVFGELGFRVLMCKDQSQQQMQQALSYFSSLRDTAQTPETDVKEWLGNGFGDLRQTPLKHGDAFVCCILSHGSNRVVYGTDRNPLSIRKVTQLFKGSERSALTGKPKVFLIQACQGNDMHRGVRLLSDSSYSAVIPEEADVLVAIATVEDYLSFRDPEHGSWFIQSLCEELKSGCARRDDVTSILLRVNDDVSRKEGSLYGIAVKQMPEVRFTLRKKLVLPPLEDLSPNDDSAE